MVSGRPCASTIRRRHVRVSNPYRTMADEGFGFLITDFKVLRLEGRNR